MRRNSLEDVPDYIRDRRAFLDSAPAGMLLYGIALIGMGVTCSAQVASYRSAQNAADCAIAHSDQDTSKPCSEAG